MIQPKLHANWKLIVFFTLGFQFCVFAQQVSTLQNGVQGIWIQNSSDKIELKKWESQWIWMPENIESDVMLARRSFDLKELPTKAILRISASSKYELFVNGIPVCQGPARSAPHHQSFDILDISSILNEGKNSIAVRVHYQQGTTSYHLKGRAGLLVQLDIENQTIISDSNWKVSPDLSWDNNSPAMNRFQLVVNAILITNP
jgi:alpha-L-rhamnosidase